MDVQTIRLECLKLAQGDLAQARKMADFVMFGPGVAVVSGGGGGTAITAAATSPLTTYTAVSNQ